MNFALRSRQSHPVFGMTKAKESIGRFSSMVSLYPVCNPDCEIRVDEVTFVENIKREYADYLATHDGLTFECTAYGVKESHTYLRESHGS